MFKLERELSRFLGKPKAKRQPDLDAKARREFKALASELGFTFKKTNDGYVECSPCKTFPKGLTTSHYNWAETLERVKLCAEDLTLIVDGYELHLYCKRQLPISYEGHKPGFHAYKTDSDEFGGSNEAEAKREARRSGWKFVNGDVLCPQCAKEMVSDKPRRN